MCQKKSHVIVRLILSVSCEVRHVTPVRFPGRADEAAEGNLAAGLSSGQHGFWQVSARAAAHLGGDAHGHGCVGGRWRRRICPLCVPPPHRTSLSP